MPHTDTRSRKPAVATVIVLLLACLGLAACGGSSSNTTSTSTNVASTGTATGASSTGSTSTTPGAPGSGRGSGHFAAMRECLQKNGITLPKRTPGSHPGGGFVPGAGAGGGPKLTGGATRAQYEAALKKCGGGSGHFFGGAARRLNNPVFKSALTKYGDCLRENGIKLPAPNTSGNGPIFDTKGIDTNSSQFKTASAKCRSALTGAFRRPAGAPGAAGAPPAGGSPAGNESSTG
jgi:hypothetical protein